MGPLQIFIDHLSLRPYQPGEVWTGHRQFCEQFLNPLLLRSIFGIPHNAWYRGTLEGIPTESLARMLPLTRKMSLPTFLHVVMQDRLQRKAAEMDIAPQRGSQRAR